jgi:hypothetical protein
MKNFLFGVSVVTAIVVGVSLVSAALPEPSPEDRARLQALGNCVHSKEVAFKISMMKDRDPSLKSLDNNHIAHILCKDADPAVWVK